MKLIAELGNLQKVQHTAGNDYLKRQQYSFFVTVFVGEVEITERKMIDVRDHGYTLNLVMRRSEEIHGPTRLCFFELLGDKAWSVIMGAKVDFTASTLQIVFQTAPLPVPPQTVLNPDAKPPG